jgi:hypothetical protein
MTEIQFRDGLRNVPDHLAAAMAELPTYKLTHAEAIDAANQRLMSDRINREADKVLRNHFAAYRR